MVTPGFFCIFTIMEKKIQYRVSKHEYFNQYSEVTNEYYFIQKYSPNWLGMWRWRDITHTECFYGDCNEVTTRFKTQEEAEVFVTTKLCTGLPKDEDVDTVVKTFDCGNHG